MRDFSKCLIPPSLQLRGVIEAIDASAIQIALVVDSDGRLLGTVTDGDIRRALLKGSDLDTPVAKIMEQNFRSVPAASSDEMVLAIMRREVLHQIPGLNECGCVTRLFLLEDLVQPKMLSNPVVIMAGGEGKRLGPLTQNCPKPMLTIGDKPLLEVVLQQCIDVGFCNFYISVNYLKGQIKDYFGSGKNWGVSIQYIEEDKPLGTAGPLSLLDDSLVDPVLVINGDVLSRANYSRLLKFHLERQSNATLCVREHVTQIPYGVIRTEGGNVIALEEKPVLRHYINAGIYLLNREVIDLVPNDLFYDMPQLLELAISEHLQVVAYPLHEEWIDVGHPNTLALARKEW